MAFKRKYRVLHDVVVLDKGETDDLYRVKHLRLSVVKFTEVYSSKHEAQIAAFQMVERLLQANIKAVQGAVTILQG